MWCWAQFENWKTKYDIQVGYVQCNNANDFERACKKEGMGIKFECATSGTPQ